MGMTVTRASTRLRRFGILSLVLLAYLCNPLRAADVPVSTTELRTAIHQMEIAYTAKDYRRAFDLFTPLRQTYRDLALPARSMLTDDQKRLFAHGFFLTCLIVDLHERPGLSLGSGGGSPCTTAKDLQPQHPLYIYGTIFNLLQSIYRSGMYYPPVIELSLSQLTKVMNDPKAPSSFEDLWLTFRGAVHAQFGNQVKDVLGGHWRYLLLRAALHADLGHVEETLSDYHQAVEQGATQDEVQTFLAGIGNPSLTVYTSARRGLQFGVSYYEGGLLLEDAPEEFERAFREGVAPQWPLNDPRAFSPAEQFQLYQYWGDTLIVMEDYARGMQHYAEALRLQPHSADIYARQCWASALLDHSVTALQACAEALRLQPGHAFALSAQALAYYRLGRQARAERELNAARQTDANLWTLPMLEWRILRSRQWPTASHARRDAPSYTYTGAYRASKRAYDDHYERFYLILKYWPATTPVERTLRAIAVFGLEHPLGIILTGILGLGATLGGFWIVVTGMSRWHDARRLRPALPRQPRYLNTGYRLAAFLWFVFWITALSPVLLGAWHIAYETALFSWEGLTTISLEAVWESIDASLTAWLLPWLGTLAGTFLAFIICKLSGRYALQKADRPRIRPLYGTARLIFFLLSLIGLGSSLVHLSKTVDQVVEGGVLIPPEDDREFRDTIVATAGRAAIRNDFDRVIQEALQAGDFERARAFVTAAALFDRPISQATQTMYDQEASAGDTLLRQGGRCGKGAILRTATTITEIACAFVLDLTPFGDPLDLIAQGRKSYAGEEVDDVIVGLSLAGIVLYWLPDFLGGQREIRYGALAAKHTLKAAKHVKASSRLTRRLRHLSAEAFDPQGITNAALSGPRAARRYFSRPAAKQAQEVFTDIGSMAVYGNITTPIVALKYADDLEGLRLGTRVSRVFSKQTDAVMVLLKYRLYKLFKVYKLAWPVRLILGGWTALLALSWTTLFSTLFSVVRSRVFRIITLRFLRRVDERRMARAA